MFRPALGLILILMAVPGSSLAQHQESSVVFTSPDKQVTLHKGTNVTFKTVRLSDLPQERLAPPGIFLETTLRRDLDGKACKPGDPVELTLVYPIQFDSAGQTIRIPAHATVSGHVVLVRRRDSSSPKSQLAFVSDFISWQAEKVALPAVVVAAREPEVAKNLEPPAFVGAANSRGKKPFEPSRGLKGKDIAQRDR